MIDTKEKSIDNHVIMVTQYPGRRAFTYKARLVKLLGPSIARIFSNGQSDIEVMTEALDTLVARIEPDALTLFILELLCGTRIDGKEITGEVFDNEFSGNMLLMYKILIYTLEVNYGGFFGEGGIGKILTKVKGTTPPEASKKSMKP
jgi:hypothetical protein